MREVTGWLPAECARKAVQNLLTEREATARDMVSAELRRQAGHGARGATC